MSTLNFFFTIYFLLGLYTCHVNSDWSVVQFYLKGFLNRIIVGLPFTLIYYYTQQEPPEASDPIATVETIENDLMVTIENEDGSVTYPVDLIVQAP